MRDSLFSPASLGRLIEGAAEQFINEKAQQQKRAPDPEAMGAPKGGHGGGMLTTYVPRQDIKAYARGRKARKALELEKERQWEMDMAALRARILQKLLAMGAVFSMDLIERTVDEILDRYFNAERLPIHNQIMEKVAMRIIDQIEAGVLAVNDTLPERLGQYL